MNAPLEKTPPHPHTPSKANAASTPAVRAAGAGAVAQAARAPGPRDFAALRRRVFAHWPVVIVTLLVGGLITLQVVRTRKPQFKSETVVLYREGIGKSVTGPTEDKDALRLLGPKLKETLLAQQTLRGIIDEFHLYADTVERAGYAAAVDQMRKKTEFKARSQDTFAISFEGTTREEAQQVCARMAEILVAENARRLHEDNRSTTEFLQGEKRRADEELERIEREISGFLNEHPQFAKEAEQKRKPAEATSAPRPDRDPGPQRQRPSAAVAVDPMLLATKQHAQTELSVSRRELADRSLRFTDDHPDVRASKERVAAAEAAVARAEEAIAAAQPKDEGAGQGAPRPSAPADRAPRAAEPQDKIVSLEVDWARMQRALGLSRTRQIDLEQKLYRAKMIASTAESGHGTTISVLDPAYKPSNPSNAPSKTVVLIGLGASVAVGLLLSAAWGLFLDDRLFSAREVESFTTVPVLGVVPRQRDKRKKHRSDQGPAGTGTGPVASAPEAPAGAGEAADGVAAAQKRSGAPHG